jgi:membrane dipeptidase
MVDPEDMRPGRRLYIRPAPRAQPTLPRAAALAVLALTAVAALSIARAGARAGASAPTGASAAKGASAATSASAAKDASAASGTSASASLPPASLPDFYVVDLHVDTVFHALTYGRSLVGPASAKGDLSLARLRAGRYAAQVFAIWVPSKVEDEGGPAASAAYAERAFAAYEALVAAAAPDLEPARTPADLARVHAAGRIAAVLSIEGAHPLGDRPEALDVWVARGLRVLGLTWNNSNAFAEAAADPRPGAPGLTPLGRALVARAEAAGVLVDVSHASAATLRDVVAISHRPVLASHSDCAALRPHARNLTDDQLRALAATGGLVGINFHAPFVAKKKHVSLDDVATQVLHAVSAAGAAHVALGSDFDGLIVKPTGLSGADAMPALAAALLARGLPPADVAAVMGGNAYRLLSGP